MVIVYDSLTGQGKKFASKLNLTTIDIKDYQDSKELVFLVTRSFNFGEIPESTKDFLQKYHNKVCGVAVAGNKNWGKNYGAAGTKIQKDYQIPLVRKFEGSGFNEDVVYVKNWIKEYNKDLIMKVED